MAAHFLKRLVRELEDNGIRRHRVVQGGKHLRLEFEIGGCQRWITISSTPSTQNAIYAALSDLRRAAGIERVAKDPCLSRTTKKVPHRITRAAATALASIAPMAPVLPDPWAALKALKAQMQAEVAATRLQRSAVDKIFAPAAVIKSQGALPERIRLTTPWLGQRVRFQEAA